MNNDKACLDNHSINKGSINFYPPKNQRWKKLLYLKQPYPDNYTDTSFLDQLKTNSTVSKYSYWKLIYDFSIISFYITTIIINLLVFSFIYKLDSNFKFNLNLILIISFAFFFIGFVIWTSTNKLTGSSFKSLLLIIFILLVLSPVLKSLTRSTSSDSIWALSFILCSLNVLCHDFSLNIEKSVQYRPIFSTNLSIANGIVLASRLNSTVEVFCFLLFTIQINILLPFFHFIIRKNFNNSTYHFSLFGLLQLITFTLIYKLLNFKITLFWGFVQFIIVFALPAYFLFLQKYKNELQGPWDPAKPIIKTL